MYMYVLEVDLIVHMYMYVLEVDLNKIIFCCLSYLVLCIKFSFMHVTLSPKKLAIHLYNQQINQYMPVSH